ncbi:BrnT family toxin [SAR92 clade bacterium H455]|uniref:BrnT family toxin n=1 Tax=SAR92 clade bacterium H455 TaxID=2974818 RepID=A0ABY5TKB5_9GAMM|nr:BrnT family toxin [SAR92 clade bacterium H455]
MINWAELNGFECDQGNARKSETKHDVTKFEPEQIFFNQPILVVEDSKHSQTKSRYHALDITDSARQLHVTFTLRNTDTLSRVISARDMHQKERTVYEQAKKDA